MYFPYLRGKQYELLALRALSALPLNSKKISPIIEPLKEDDTSLKRMVKALPKDLFIQIILNPQFGEIPFGNELIANTITDLHNDGYTNVIPSFLVKDDNDLHFINTIFSKFPFSHSGYSLVHLNQITSSSTLISLVGATNCIYNIIHINHIMSLKPKFPQKTIGCLEDRFVRQVKNSDYAIVTDEFYSDTHLIYKSNGYIAFSDYLTIGSSFIDGGQSPWAVAIHLTYIDKQTNQIRIQHFVSDSNSDQSDTGGKFSEALSKLILFINTHSIFTVAANEFRAIHTRGSYHGLGTIKKLSIMHHIELVQSLL